MTLTPEQLMAGIEYFQILANIQRRLLLEEQQKSKKEKDNAKSE